MSKCKHPGYGPCYECGEAPQAEIARLQAEVARLTQQRTALVEENDSLLDRLTKAEAVVRAADEMVKAFNQNAGWRQCEILEEALAAYRGRA